jgi:hypothetical protein
MDLIRWPRLSHDDPLGIDNDSLPLAAYALVPCLEYACLVSGLLKHHFKFGSVISGCGEPLFAALLCNGQPGLLEVEELAHLVVLLVP